MAPVDAKSDTSTMVGVERAATMNRTDCRRYATTGTDDSEHRNLSARTDGAAFDGRDVLAGRYDHIPLRVLDA